MAGRLCVTVKCCPHGYLCPVHVEKVGGGPVFEGTEVVVGVVSRLVSFVDDTSVKFRMACDVLPDDKECGLGVIAGKGVEDEGRCLGYGAVVKGKIDGPLVWVHPPRCVGIDPSQPLCRLFDNHIFLISLLLIFLLLISLLLIFLLLISLLLYYLLLPLGETRMGTKGH